MLVELRLQFYGMSSELVSRGTLRMSDADRELVLSRLHTAVGEGRLTLGEFEERTAGVLAARTFGEVEPFLADLPTGPVPASAPTGPVEMSATGSKISRTGRWTVPAELRIHGVGSAAVLDFTEAILTTSTVTVNVDLWGSSVKLIVPQGTSVDAGGASLVGSSAKVRRLPTYPESGRTGLHISITGTLKGSSLKASPPRVWFWQRWQRRR
jgi:hypothetical protein